MSDHDPFCRSHELLPSHLPRFCDCEWVSRIRADERHKVETEGTDITRWHQGLVLTYLRAKVAALKDQYAPFASYEEAVDDVLSLLDEAAS